MLWERGRQREGLRAAGDANGARSFILMYRAGRGRAAPLRKVTIGPFGSPWTVETARTEAKRILGEVAAGRDPAGDRAEKRAVQKAGVEAKDSVRAAVDEWIKRDQADNRTVDDVRRRMDREVIPLWGDRALASIRKRDVIELVDGIADRGKMMANRTLAHVRRFFNWCASRDLIEANPAQFVEKPAAEVRRDRVLDDGELVEVWRALDGMVKPFAAGVRLLILTGARRSEIFEARKGELVPGAIRLPAERAKNDEGRLIHLSPPAQAIVDGLTDWPACPYLLTRTASTRSPASARPRPSSTCASPPRGARRPRKWARSPSPCQHGGSTICAAASPPACSAWACAWRRSRPCSGHVSGSRAGIVGVYQRHRFTRRPARR